MSIKESLVATLQLYQAILQEMRDYKADEYKQGVADGMDMVLEAVRVCLEDSED